jgi:hypothetical protein
MVPTVAEIIRSSEHRYQAMVYADSSMATIVYVSPLLRDTYIDAQLDAELAVTTMTDTRAYPRATDTHCACCAADTVAHIAHVHGDVVGVCSWACADRLDNIWRPRAPQRTRVSWGTVASLLTIGACIVASVL